MGSEIFHFPVGNFRCMVLSDRSSAVTENDITRVFAQDPERMLAAFRELPVPFNLGSNILLVETPEKRVLIDSGNGHIDPTDLGHLLDHLHSEHIAPESIDTLIITHFHLDHICGLLDGEGNPTFTGARLVVPKLEHDYWMNESFLAVMDPNRAQRLRATVAAYASRLTLMDQGIEIEPGISYVLAPGHTPGHSAVRVESQGVQLLHVADTVHMPIQLNAVDASPKFDVQPDVAITTRRNTIKQVESEQILMMAFHFPFPGLGHIERSGDRFVWVPVSPSAV